MPSPRVTQYGHSFLHHVRQTCASSADTVVLYTPQSWRPFTLKYWLGSLGRVVDQSVLQQPFILCGDACSLFVGSWYWSCGDPLPHPSSTI